METKTESKSLLFLRKKKMIRPGCERFVISGDFGVMLLNDLLDEYAKEQMNDTTQCMSCERTIPTDEAIVYCDECSQAGR